ncbi:potassium channel family protein [Clostridium oryzae]|uniref:Ktr system potassium uptake protein A n=1 Tax=Clostridium oryzae TaxID=1450648 RepID=A0A1V4IGL6_9CLOT|nr:TrkA family potassium uptake protein [Clostridium oryzae]OPJ59059.1 Ktr system potassium uptake protein A [Clostridium oryzae]
MEKKQFVVIGMGKFGSSVAKTLYSLGNDVLAIDSNEDIIQEVSESVTHAVQMDATDEMSLRSLGIKNFDVAVITIGSDIQSSVMSTLLIKELGVKYIIAKAHSEIHAKLLRKIGADRVVLPEKDMGIRVAHNLVSSNILDFIELSPDYSIAEVACPSKWNGRTLRELNLRSVYGITVMAIKRSEKVSVSPGADDRIQNGDMIVAIGKTENLSKFEHNIS